MKNCKKGEEKKFPFFLPLTTIIAVHAAAADVLFSKFIFPFSPFVHLFFAVTVLVSIVEQREMMTIANDGHSDFFSNT
jgi:uncharacterized membrane protein